MNKVLQQEGGDVLFVGKGKQFHTKEREGLATLQVAKQQEVKINIERGELEIQIDIGIHLMEQLFMTTNVEPSRGLIWTPTKNDIFLFQETIASSTL